MAKKKKWKKKLGKALMAGAALAGGLALAKRGRSSPFLSSGAAGGARLPKGDAYARAKRLMTSDRAYTGSGYDDPIMTGGVGVKHSRRPMWTGDQRMVDDYPMYKKGGRVTGVAKRGFGRALKKGKK
jgi:hypothetical protein